ncbi:hypothetical protein BC332_32120 [Capsicum chinense]|nr:hypothetical protein BC332_32120 [Capsicum chinense]
MCNSEASPNLSSTPSSVHGLDLPPPGKLDQLRRVRIIADGEGFYPSRPAANVISAGIQKLYDGFYPTWSDVSDRTKQGVFNEFMWQPLAFAGTALGLALLAGFASTAGFFFDGAVAGIEADESF